MKTTIWLFCLGLLFTGCTTSKTIPSQWMSNDFKQKQLDRMLVFANSEDRELQNRFEDKMAIVLIAEGITPLKMHELFPEVVYKEERTKEEINDFVMRCKEKNIDKILFASQKSMIVDTVPAKNLHNYMNSLEPLNLDRKRKDDLVYDTKELTTYIIEAAVYDIAVTTEDKPIATATIKATDPKSVEKLEDRFLKEIERLFKDR